MNLMNTPLAWLLVVPAACAHGSGVEAETTSPTTASQTVAVAPAEPIAIVTTGVRDLDGDPSMVEVDVSLAAAALPPEPVVTEDVCPEPLVYFALDSAVLDADAQHRLAEFAECARSVEAERIRVSGHADPQGTEIYNRRLALERAREVEQHLRDELGLTVPIEVAAHGEERARNRVLWPNDRRVEVELIEGS
jgi:outer membrane protein OmpA-like peptidoglycan-associated protein